MIKDFVKSGIIYSIPNFLSRGLQIILVPLYTRVLSTADYGTLDLLSGFGNLIVLTVALEISQAVALFVGRTKEEAEIGRIASTGLWFTIVMYVLFVSVAQVFAEPLARLVLEQPGLTIVFRVSILQIALGGVTRLIHEQLRWQLRPNEHVVGSILTIVVGAAASVLLTVVYDLGVLGMILGLVAGNVATLAYSVVRLRSTFRFRFDQALLATMLRFSIPLVPSGIAVLVSRFVDRFMINYYLTLDDVGLYGIAFRLAGVVSLLITGFRQAMTPLVYARADHPDTPRNLARLFRYFLAFFLVIFAALSLFADEVFILMTTPPFYEAAKIVPILVPAVLLSSMYIFAPGPFIRHRTKRVLAINILGAAVNAGLNFVLIPRYGYAGAATATLIGYALTFVAYMIVNHMLYPVPHRWGHLTFATTIIVLVVVAGLQQWFPGGDRIFVKLLLVLIVTLLTVGLRVVTLEEVRHFSRLTRARLNRRPE